jgi:DNA replication and repair protein RecF
MHVTHLSLTNFRNYGRLELPLPTGPVLLHGNNAQGKTNLLEALYYLATTRSPHTAQDDELINWTASQSQEPVIVGRLVAQVTTAEGERHIEMRLIKEQQGGYNGQSSFRREALVNRRKVRLMDLLGNLRVVMFLPEDMGLITGSPAARRAMSILPSARSILFTARRCPNTIRYWNSVTPCCAGWPRAPAAGTCYPFLAKSW